MEHPVTMKSMTLCLGLSFVFSDFGGFSASQVIPWTGQTTGILDTNKNKRKKKEKRNKMHMVHISISMYDIS